MTWNAVPTAVFQQAPPYTWWNAYVRDNLNETAPAKAVAGSWPQTFAVAGTNSIAAREIRDATVTTSETTTLTSYDDLPSGTVGPGVTLTTGSFALCFPASRCVNSSTGVSYASFDVTGATTSGATDGRGIAHQGTDDMRAAGAQLLALTAGSNVFTMRYRVSSFTGTFESRRLCVMAL